MSRRGVSLIWALALTALFFTLAMAAATRLDQARFYARNRVDSLRARSQAASGCRLARAQLARGLWKAPFTFQSPEQDGSFRVQIQPGGRIVCRGRSGKMEHEQRSQFP